MPAASPRRKSTPARSAAPKAKTPAATASTRSVHHVLSTHWDREWYEPFQTFRYRLVHLLDEVLQGLQTPEGWSAFQLDGQSIPIEDYLHLRPEQAPLVQRLAGEGRLMIGPWYTLPDEFIPGGESLIRNLQEGLRVAERFGPPSKVGFLCDIFGHNSQMPQILQGFGIRSAFVWRGVNEEQVGPAFNWTGADGSQVLAYHFGPSYGYCDYTFKVRQCNDYAAGFDPAERAPAYLNYLAELAARHKAALPLLVFDGGDHMEVEPATPALLKQLAADPAAAGYRVGISTLDRFAEELWAARAAIGLTLHGELREPGRPWTKDSDATWLIAGVLSSRITQKQINARCEALLTQWAEPWGAFAAAQGLPYPGEFLREAWRQLLANHAHDSICGCSIDQVHRDVQNRFEQAEVLGERLVQASLRHLAQGIVAGATTTDGAEQPAARLVVFNPTAEAIDEPVDLEVALPLDTPAFQEFFGYERKPGFWLEGPDGGRIPYQRLAHVPSRWHFERQHRKFPRQVKVHATQVCAPLEIPAFGYTTLAVRLAAEGEPTRHGGASLLTGPGRAENEFLALEITGGGRLTLRDKRNGQQYEGLLTLEDRADIGDGWNHCPPLNDAIQTSQLAAGTVTCLAEGPQCVVFQVGLDWTLPEAFDGATARRSAHTTQLHVEHRITLRAGATRVEVRTRVENTARDHRLRLLFPTGAKADSYLADSPFDAVRRPIALQAGREGWREIESDTKPQHAWTAVGDARRGLAIISAGLPESAVLDQPERPIALTLLRSVARTYCTDGEPEGQLLQPLSFDTWIVPLQGAADVRELTRLGQRLAAGIRQVEVWGATGSGALPVSQPLGTRPAAQLPARASLLEVTGGANVSAVRQDAQGRLVVRVYNPGTQATRCSIRRPEGIQAAWQADLNEQAGDALPLKRGAVTFNVPAKRIATVVLG